MSWVCSNCSSSNRDDTASCMVCGAAYSAPVGKRGAEECKVVFSDFDAFWESVKGLFKKRSSPKKEGTKPPKREMVRAPKKERSSEDSETVRLPKAKKPKKKETDSVFAAPWAEHKIRFDSSVIESKGFVRSEREALNGVNGYRFYRGDGSSQFIRIEMVLVQKMARRV